MSEEIANVEKKAEKIEQDVKPVELSEQDFDKVACGGTFASSKSNVKTS